MEIQGKINLLPVIHINRFLILFLCIYIKNGSTLFRFVYLVTHHEYFYVVSLTSKIGMDIVDVVVKCP